MIRDYMNLEALLLCESLLWLRFTWRNKMKKKWKWNRRWSLLEVLSAVIYTWWCSYTSSGSVPRTILHAKISRFFTVRARSNGIIFLYDLWPFNGIRPMIIVFLWCWHFDIESWPRFQPNPRCSLSLTNLGQRRQLTYRYIIYYTNNAWGRVVFFIWRLLCYVIT